MEFAKRIYQYINDHADEIAEMVEARNTDEMT